MDENMTQLTKVEQEHIITQLASTIQRICKHYTNGFYYPNDLPTSMMLQFTETMEGFHRSYGNRIARSLMAGCMEYEDFDSIVQSVATVDVSERKRLANIIRATNRQVQQYRTLTKLSNASSFLFISEQSDTTCDRCMSRHGQLYRIEDLQSGTDIPPLHPNCQCALVALDMVMTLQYNQNKHWFVSQMTEIVAGHSGLLQMSGNGTLSEIAILDDGTPQIYHLIDNDVAIGAMSLSLSVDRFVQWAIEFGGDAVDLVGAIIARGQAQMLHAADELTYNPIYAVVLFADALTGTIASGISETIVSLLVDFSEDIAPYNLLNLLTFGWLDTTNRALNPEEMWSFQHFMDMIGSVIFLFGAVFGAPIAADQLKDIFSRHIDDVASGSVDDIVAGTMDDVVRPIVGDDLLNMTPQEVDDILQNVASEYGDIISTESANNKNISILNRNPTYEPSYIPDTTTYQITLNQDTKFVRVYGGSSSQMGSWIVSADDIFGLTPTQIQSKLSLPQIPEYICDVVVPAGTSLEISGANGILGGLGGGVQFFIQIDYASAWFTNSRIIG